MLIGKLLLLICKKKNEVAYQGKDVFSALETNFILKIQNIYAQLTDGLLCQDSRPEI